MDEMSRIRSALAFLDASMSRDQWVKVGMAIKSELGDHGFQIFDEWSQGASNYSAVDARDAWKSIKPNGPVTIATLYKMAKDRGWKDAHRHLVAIPKPVIQANEAADRDREEKQAQAARKALELWKTSPPAKADHPYLKRKGVMPTQTLREASEKLVKSVLGYSPKSDGRLLSGRILVVPVKVGEKLSTIELIDENGLKTALAGGAKSGGFWCSAPLEKGVDSPKSILVAEGIATALSASEATGYPSVASLSVGNMGKTALAIKKRFPESKIVILADLDKSTGQAHQQAQKAAESAGAILIAPDFGQERQPHETDFNDMHASKGLEAVSKRILDAVNHAAASDDAPGGKVLSRTKSKSPRKSDETAYFSYLNGRFEVDDEGVRFAEKRDGEWQLGHMICARLDILAATRDSKSGEWGRLLEWKDSDGTVHQWAMPMELIAGDGLEAKRELVRQGLHIEPGKTARERLLAYLQVWPTERRARCVDKLGWNEGAFVTPNETFGKGTEPLVFQNSSAVEAAMSTSGTLDEWRSSVSSLAVGNTRLIFGISAAFAGTLADITKEDSGGFHLIGSSSSGKSSTLKVAGSVWGPPNTYVRSWRSTANALEGLAALHNDSTLILDELSQIDPKEAGQASYLLSNGAGKSRATRTGSARQAAKWRLIFLSAGEESIASLMTRAGMKANAGQEIRLADIDADAGAGMGAFECTHQFKSPAELAVSIKESANRYHGTAGAAWLDRLVNDRQRLEGTLSESLSQFVKKYAPQGSSGQVERVARRFGLVAAGGELATLYGITGWAQGDATAAASKCFASWLELFGGPGNKEDRAIVEQVVRFLGLHGSARFETTRDRGEGHDPRTINRVGFYEKGDDGIRHFFVFPSMLSSEICPGYQSKAVVKALLNAGILIPGKNGEPQQKRRLPDVGSRRVYVLQYNDES